jgi:hypothetical protein
MMVELLACEPEFTISELPRLTASITACCSTDGGGTTLADCVRASWAARNESGSAGGAVLMAGTAIETAPEATECFCATAATGAAAAAADDDDNALTTAGQGAYAHSRFIPHALHASSAWPAPKLWDICECRVRVNSD